jgi:hypothetical protein
MFQPVIENVIGLIEQQVRQTKKDDNDLPISVSLTKYFIPRSTNVDRQLFFVEVSQSPIMSQKVSSNTVAGRRAFSRHRNRGPPSALELRHGACSLERP